jgi:carbonic anhydrase
VINETTNALCGVAAATFFIANCLSAQGVDPGHYVSPWKTPWTYEGMRGADHWSVLDTAYAACNRGTAQSPVDIQHPEMADLPPLRFENHSAPLTHVINNGHTIRVNYYAPGSGDFLTVGSARYQLIQFHFHRPSEELVRGQSYPMVAHLMYQTTRGQAAGVAVLLVAGRANSTVQRVWDRMPIHEGQEDVSRVDLDPAGLLPSDLGYYTYEGSVTAPPCTEGVTWYVLKAPAELSQAQIAAFARLYPMNARPVQALNDRVVRETR